MTLEIKHITDLDTLMAWRCEVIGNVFGEQPSEELMAANYIYYQKHIADGSHVAVLAEIDGTPAGCGAICITDELPSPDNHTGRCAYLMNIYVRRQFRKHGIGHAIVEWLVEKARQMNCDKIYLETTDEACSLYAGLGFKPLPGIMKLSEK